MTTAPQIQTGGIMARLRGETAEQHHQAESHALQRAMATGKLPRETYAAYLGQLMFMHRALEAELRKHREAGSHRAIADVYRTDVDKTALLVDDLTVLGVDAKAVEALPATRAFVNELGIASEREPVALLGTLYVLEGSTNGGRFIARAVSRAYGLSDRKGYSYLDPYGDEQPMRWQRFKAQMDAVGFGEQESNAIVAAAAAMFTAIGAVSGEVWEAAGQPAEASSI